MRILFLAMSITVQAVNVTLAVIALWLLKQISVPGPKGWPVTGNLLDVPTELGPVSMAECSNDFLYATSSK